MILSLRSGLMTDMAENITNMPPIAIFCYDFDGTLIPGNMQEYGLIQSLGFKTPGDFWSAVLEYTKQTGSESVLSYMKFMADCGAAVETNPLTKDSFRAFGEKMEYFKGGGLVRRYRQLCRKQEYKHRALHYFLGAVRNT